MLCFAVIVHQQVQPIGIRPTRFLAILKSSVGKLVIRLLHLLIPTRIIVTWITLPIDEIARDKSIKDDVHQNSPNCWIVVFITKLKVFQQD